MVSFPNCKINLGLHVTGKRAGGYHNLETVFYPVALKDAIEIIQGNTFSFTSSGLSISGNVDDNLCVKAYKLLQNQFTDLPTVQMHLLKNIPMGAGLGGGSADGAFMLMLLNNKFQLGLTQQQLMDFALQLGSDCPFFIINTPCFATGRGENLELIELDLSSFDIVLVNPGIHVSTAKAFAQLIPAKPQTSIQKIITQPIETWKDALINDFEKPVFEMFPLLAEIKESLYNAGALYASMSGSGSTVFGLFKKDDYNLPTFDETFKVYVV